MKDAHRIMVCVNYLRRFYLADRTGLEPATSAVTGRHSNQLNYRSIPCFWDGKDRGFDFLPKKTFGTLSDSIESPKPINIDPLSILHSQFSSHLSI